MRSVNVDGDEESNGTPALTIIESRSDQKRMKLDDSKIDPLTALAGSNVINSMDEL